MKNILAIFIFATLFSVSCSKPSQQDDSNGPYNLSFTVTDASKKPISGASIKLYLTIPDYDSDRNVTLSGITDSLGNLVFPGKNNRSYYFSITKADGCWSNIFSGFTYTGQVITSGNSVNIPVTLDQTAVLNLHNSSQYPFDIFINGKLICELTGGYSVEVESKAEPLKIEVKQTQGFVTTPIDEIFNDTLTSCSNSFLNFP